MLSAQLAAIHSQALVPDRLPLWAARGVVLVALMGVLRWGKFLVAWCNDEASAAAALGMLGHGVALDTVAAIPLTVFWSFAAASAPSPRTRTACAREVLLRSSARAGAVMLLLGSAFANLADHALFLLVGASFQLGTARYILALYVDSWRAATGVGALVWFSANLAMVSPQLWVPAALVAAALMAAPSLAVAQLRRRVRRRTAAAWGRRAAVGCVMLAAAWPALCGVGADGGGAADVSCLVASRWNVAVRLPAQLAAELLMPGPSAVDRDVARGVRGSSNSGSNSTRSRGGGNAAAPPDTQNVIVVMLESTALGVTSLPVRGGGLYSEPNSRHSTRDYSATAAPPSTPFLASLLRPGSGWGHVTLVERFYAVMPNTMKALWAVSCGVVPFLGVESREYGMSKAAAALREEHCLPHLFRHSNSSIATAYFTASSVGNQPLLGYDKTRSGAQLNAAQGGRFERANWLGFDESVVQAPLRQWLRERRRRQERFFLHITSCNTHSPFVYEHPPSRCNASSWSRRFAASLPPRRTRLLYGELSDYLASVRCGDAFVEELMGAVRAEGLVDSTTFVLVADHGEGQGRKLNDFSHGSSVYETQVRIPLLVVGPGARRLPRRLGGAWSQIALSRTILDMMGLLAPHDGAGKTATGAGGPSARESTEPWTGASMLRRGGAGQPPLPGETFFTCAFDNMCAGLVTAGGTKYVYHIPFERLEVYETVGDPREESDIAATIAPSVRRHARDRILRWVFIARLAYNDVR